MSDALVASAFETTLKAWADAQTPAIPVAWENVTFNPPVGRYIRATLLPATTNRLFLDGSGRSLVGIFEVHFYMPIGSGAKATRTLVSSLDAAFSVTITASGLRIYLTSPFSAAPPIPIEDRFVVPASASYRAYSE